MNTPTGNMHEDSPDGRPRVTTPRLGRGTRLIANDLGYAISQSSTGGKYPHPFKPALSGSTLAFSRGLVDGIYEPKIGTVPISGDARGRQPRLKLLPGVANAAGESWACLEVVLNAGGELTAESRMEVVHSNEPVSRQPLVGRCALALIVWRGTRPSTVFSIVKFNLRYHRLVPAAGAGVVQHLFL